MSITKAIFALTVTASLLGGIQSASAQGYYNPELFDSGRRVTGAHYDPFTGQIIVRTDRTKVRESYLDPNRGQIDPGSYRNVNRYETDLNGVQWHVTGTQWTSNGVPHGNLSRRRVGGGSTGPGGIQEDRNEHVAFGAQVNGSKSNSGQRTTPGNPRRQVNQPKSFGYSPF